MLKQDDFVACYNCVANRVSGEGFQLTCENLLSDYLRTRVWQRWADIEGENDIRSVLDGVVRTDFEEDQLAQVFSRDDAPEPWQVGELLAECLLEDLNEAYFPWNTLRDIRSTKASLPGADIVGFISTPSGVRFLFGEAKVSSDAQAPPGVMYGRSGMARQIEHLRDDRKSRDRLFMWLGHRVLRTEWAAMYREAAGAYLGSCGIDVMLVGMLMRDTPPTRKDLESRAQSLDHGNSKGMTIRLFAYYFPIPIADWPRAMAGRAMS